MNIYFDLSIILYVITSALSLFFLSCIRIVKPKFYHYFILSILSSCQIVFLYVNIAIKIVYFMAHILLFLTIYKRKVWSTLLSYLFFYYSALSLCTLIFPYIRFYRGIFIITHAGGLYFLMILPIGFIILYLVTKFIDYLFHLSTYKVDIILYINDKKYKSTGFFDTGNLLKEGNIPVIFILKSAIDSKDIDFDIPIHYQTIQGEDIVFGKQVLIQILPKKEYHFVYLCPIKQKNDFHGCEVLLNGMIQ